MNNNNSINLSANGVMAIQSLQHTAGTFSLYDSTLARLAKFVLHWGDEIGMSDREAISTLRAIDALRSDLGYIAGPAAVRNPEEGEEYEEEAFEDIGARVEAVFSGIDLGEVVDVESEEISEDQDSPESCPEDTVV